MEFLDALASRQAAPGGGAAAAMTAAMAAALVAMVARSSPGLDGADEVVDEADRLRARALGLVDEDGRCYREVLAAEPERETDPARFQAALEGANRPPAAVIAVADRATELAARLAEDGSRRLRGDAIAAVVLGEAAAASATELIALNTAYGRLPEEHLTIARARRESCRARLERVGVAR